MPPPTSPNYASPASFAAFCTDFVTAFVAAFSAASAALLYFAQKQREWRARISRRAPTSGALGSCGSISGSAGGGDERFAWADSRELVSKTLELEQRHMAAMEQGEIGRRRGGGEALRGTFEEATRRTFPLLNTGGVARLVCMREQECK